MTRDSHPGERLLDRLQMGFTEPDEELFERARTFSAWARNNPLSALRWLPKLRRTHYCTARLWKAIEHIVDPVAALPRQQTPASVERLPAQPPEEAPAAAPREAGLPAEYDAWRRSLPPAAVADAVKFAPARASEALELEVRARQPITYSTKLAILKRAAAIWSALLNVKDPDIW